MILSHKYKFFFIRPLKVAGSSILYNLGKHCGDQDIVNSPDKAIARSNRIYETNFQSVKKNFNQIQEANNRVQRHGINKNRTHPRIHISPFELKHTFPREWETYAKIGAVRNPWDAVYSMYVFEKKYFPEENIPHECTFTEWVDSTEASMINERTALDFWFDRETGLPIEYDFMIKYENLENDYKNVCEHFGIPYEPLVKLYTDTRMDVDPDRTYQKHYNARTRDYIGNLYSKLNDRYNYDFIS